MPPPLGGQGGNGLQPYLPILPRDPGNIWGRLEHELDRIYRTFLNVSASLGFRAYVGRTNISSYPYAILFEAWIPQSPADPLLTERVSANVILEGKAYHKHEIEYTVTIHNRGVDKVLGVFGALAEKDIEKIVRHLVRNEKVPSISPQLSQMNPHTALAGGVKVTTNNKPTGVRPDYLAITMVWALLLGGLIAFLGFSEGRTSGQQVGVIGLALFIVSLIVLIVLGRRPYAVRSSGKPEREPRTLALYDSWQAVLFGAGHCTSAIRQAFENALGAAPIQGFKHVIENIQYRSVDFIEEREQIVISVGRGIIYCQIYEFGADLYIGWQSFLNRGQWIEQIVKRGIDRPTGRRIELRSVVPGLQALQEYDLMDLNCLTEWTHSQMVSLTRELMKRLEIDQEIDFKIVRGERGALNPQEPEKKAEQPRGGKLFKRTS